MTIPLHTQTCAPNTAAATSVSPLEQSGSSKTKLSKTRIDIYQTITDGIIAALEAGVKPWACPWQRVVGTPQSQPQSMGNEPPIDFDEEIPFRRRGYGFYRHAIYAIA